MAAASSSSGAQWERMISDDIWLAMGRAGIESAPDLAFFFLNKDEAREWALLQAHGSEVDSFVLAWGLCRRLIEADSSVVDKVFQLERQRVRSAAPKAMPSRPRAPPLSQADKDIVARRKRAVTDSITGFEELQVRKATRQDVHSQLDPPNAVWDELWSLWLLTGKTNLRWLEMDANIYEKHQSPGAL